LHVEALDLDVAIILQRHLDRIAQREQLALVRLDPDALLLNWRLRCRWRCVLRQRRAWRCGHHH